MIRLAYFPGIGFDLVNNNGLETDDGLETATFESLFTEAPATEDELRIAGLTRFDNRGWWGNTYPEKPGFVVGSKLWLLRRMKRNDETLARAKEWATDALAWFLEGAVAREITVITEWYKGGSILAGGIEMVRPDGTRWQSFWDFLASQGLQNVQFAASGSGGVGRLAFNDSKQSAHLLTM